MNDDTTVRLALPLLNAGQAQKELTHNEALALLDMLVQPAVVAAGLDTPPDAPVAGQAWIVGQAPAGAWTGHAGAVAGWTAGGWRYAVPADGFETWCVADGYSWRFTDGAWRSGEVSAAVLKIDGEQVVGAQRAAISDPIGGTVIDEQARAALVSILGVLRGHGLIAA